LLEKYFARRFQQGVAACLAAWSAPRGGLAGGVDLRVDFQSGLIAK
jgi:hypothetical protein